LVSFEQTLSQHCSMTNIITFEPMEIKKKKCIPLGWTSFELHVTNIPFSQVNSMSNKKATVQSVNKKISL